MTIRPQSLIKVQRHTITSKPPNYFVLIRLLHLNNLIFHEYSLMLKDVCHFGVKGLSMTFISTLVLVVAGMVMMTLRASWHEVEDEDHWMNDECSIISENRKYSLAQGGSSMSDTRQPHAEELGSDSDQNSAEHGIEQKLSSREPKRRQEPQVDEFGEDPMHNTLRSVAYR